MSTHVEQTDPITQLGEVLATAERHVQEIVSAAENRADERLRDAQAQLDARAAELNSIADELLTASALVHHQLQRLRSLVPLEGPSADRPAPAAAPPATASASAVSAAALRSAEATPPVSVDADADVTSPATGIATAVAPSPTHHHDHDLPIIGGSGHAPVPPADRLDSARLVALSMAASGRSRGEVEAHLRDELGITDHGPLIDYVFGISTPASVVPSWPPRRRRRND